jgi:mono/diheme cytochrome c family protein
MRGLGWTVLFLASLGCQLRPYDRDPQEINARYALKFKEPCSVWLTSPATGYKYCSSPAFTVEAPGAAAFAPKPAAAFASVADGPTDEAALKAHGEKVYGAICASCHQPNGTGVAGAFPPLVAAGSFYGSAENHARIIVHGLSGAIVVNGVNYNGAMPAQGQLSDYDIAAVATFERTSWGNNDGIVMPEDVARVR